MLAFGSFVLREVPSVGNINMRRWIHIIKLEALMSKHNPRTRQTHRRFLECSLLAGGTVLMLARIIHYQRSK